MSENQDDKAARLREARGMAGYDSPTDAARALGVQGPTYLGHENGSRGYGASASRYADFYRVNLEWLLTGRGPMKRQEQAAVPQPQPLEEVPTTDLNIRAMPQDLKVLGTAACGPNGLFEMQGQVLEYVRRPPRLMHVKDAYALYCLGNSMYPWREHGQLVYVHPHQPVKVGDFVVIQLVASEGGSTPEAYIKKLVRRTSESLILHQFKPEEDLKLPTKRVKAIHRIIDWSELMGI